MSSGGKRQSRNEAKRQSMEKPPIPLVPYLTALSQACEEVEDVTHRVQLAPNVADAPHST